MQRNAIIFRFILKKKKSKISKRLFFKATGIYNFKAWKKKWPNNVGLLKYTIVIRENLEQATNVTISSQISYHF